MSLSNYVSGLSVEAKKKNTLINWIFFSVIAPTVYLKICGNKDFSVAQLFPK
jgi:hypothetical protein